MAKDIQGGHRLVRSKRRASRKSLLLADFFACRNCNWAEIAAKAGGD
jgi:hypothetical protein